MKYMRNIYLLGSKLSSTTFQAKPVVINDDSSSNLALDGHRLLRGQFDDLSFPIYFVQEGGKKLRDILDTGWVGLFLVSCRIKSALIKSELTGFSFFDITLLDKKNEEISGYHGLTVTGRSGPIDYSKSPLINKSMVPNGPFSKCFKGLYIDQESWDGCDIFLSENYLGVLVNQSVKGILDDNTFSNIRYTHISEIETSEIAVN
jgi:hypothetical protein